nr:TetR/AcrR family transcriptional regulator C-terminal domain-containing protein [Arthrobacter cheniae]
MPVGGAPDTLRMYEQVAVGLINGGWPPERVVPGIVAIESFIYGSALDVSAPENIFDSGSLAGEFPTFTAAVVSSRPPGPDESRADTAFEGGLTAMISGLRDQIGVRE